ncbi:ATP-dependent DNA helicase pif1-like [Watersipora subatra]|uniref:ATP-dependent DNA helicase pif1-like n=1 Tax=Watersipora subatra TaxID=2589382 RepID=UPI00355BC5B9
MSFQHLRTVEGHVCASFHEACRRLGLLEDDAQWREALEEAATVQSPAQLRKLFAIMLSTCQLSHPLQLWQEFKEHLAEDILFHERQLLQDQQLQFTDRMFNIALIFIEDQVLEVTNNNLSVYELPRPVRVEQPVVCREILRETAYDREELRRHVETNEPLLLGEQRAAYNTVFEKIEQNSGGVVFLHAPGGTGKTFATNLILAKVRESGKIALAVASSGIAATLLPGGRTAHSALKLPLKLARTENPVCNIKKNNGTAQLLQRCVLIVWDECTMLHKLAFEALNLTLNDLRENNRLFGGVTLLLSGDFRQTLPVIQRGTPADEINACIKASFLWPSVVQLHLPRNMRAAILGDETSARFAAGLLRIGEGRLPVSAEDGLVSLDGYGTFVDSTKELQENVYPNLRQRFQNVDWLSERAILCPRNDAAAAINSQLLAQLPGNSKTFTSVDTSLTDDAAVEYPVEFLNALDLPGLPAHKLQLKIGTPIMLLRNLNPPKLSNGTRLIVAQMFSHVIQAKIISASGRGEYVFIPRIPIIPTDLPFEFKRIQFPIRVCFAMTINKSQGQSLKVAGIDLLSPCFSHGQLYVACSRVSDVSYHGTMDSSAFSNHNGMEFSTADRDNDVDSGNCGWGFERCHDSYLNGFYDSANGGGEIVWRSKFLHFTESVMRVNRD